MRMRTLEEEIPVCIAIPPRDFGAPEKENGKGTSRRGGRRKGVAFCCLKLRRRHRVDIGGRDLPFRCSCKGRDLMLNLSELVPNGTNRGVNDPSRVEYHPTRTRLMDFLTNSNSARNSSSFCKPCSNSARLIILLFELDSLSHSLMTRNRTHTRTNIKPSLKLTFVTKLESQVGTGVRKKAAGSLFVGNPNYQFYVFSDMGLRGFGLWEQTPNWCRGQGWVGWAIGARLGGRRMPPRAPRMASGTVGEGRGGTVSTQRQPRHRRREAGIAGVEKVGRPSRHRRELCSALTEGP
ncbi:hypothetical protein Taro_016755 [Colocasia esculenta]|uniref:Uncharacterized protein n=1 Tax=Colocasia esculenta TaxID=4460 RepID=A0A843UL86_COLES|nr:hypothetical protein [Colocasia esculenta]